MKKKTVCLDIMERYGERMGTVEVPADKVEEAKTAISSLFSAFLNTFPDSDSQYPAFLVKRRPKLFLRESEGNEQVYV